MFPSSDDVFYIFIKIQLYGCFNQHGPVYSALQIHISIENIPVLKKRHDTDTVSVKRDRHSKDCKYRARDRRICAVKYKFSLHFRRKYMPQKTKCPGFDKRYGFLCTWMSDKCFPPVNLVTKRILLSGEILQICGDLHDPSIDCFYFVPDPSGFIPQIIKQILKFLCCLLPFAFFLDIRI